MQQLNRILFCAAIANASSLTAEQRVIYHQRITKKKYSMTWRSQAVKEFRKPNRFDQICFDENASCFKSI